jgi:hypothetical protein
MFLRMVIVVVAIGLVSIVIAAAGGVSPWSAMIGAITAFLLLGAVPFWMGQYPFFSRRTTRIAPLFIFPVSIMLFFLLLFATQILSTVYPITFGQAGSMASQLSSIIPPSAVVVTLGQWIRERRKRITILLPKWVNLRPFGIGYPAAWAISSPEIMKKLGGVPIVIVNNTLRMVPLTMVWLEWFASGIVPRNFHRDFLLERGIGHNSRTYHRKVIQTDNVVIIKPKDSIVWTLSFEDVHNYYYQGLLMNHLVEADLSTRIRITIYDEYADRVHSSQEIPIRTILGKESVQQFYDALERAKSGKDQGTDTLHCGTQSQPG